MFQQPSLSSLSNCIHNVLLFIRRRWNTITSTKFCPIPVSLISAPEYGPEWWNGLWNGLHVWNFTYSRQHHFYTLFYIENASIKGIWPLGLWRRIPECWPAELAMSKLTSICRMHSKAVYYFFHSVVHSTIPVNIPVQWLETRIHTQHMRYVGF